MSDLSIVTEFLGWCTVLNIVLLTFLTIMLSVAKGWAKQVHGKVFKLPDDTLDSVYFSFLANYKLAILMFNFVPYIALKIMH